MSELDDGYTADQVRTAEKREAATPGGPADDQYIAALLEERRGYETHGRDDRVAEVDEQLKARGYKEAGQKRAAAAKPDAAPKGRRSAPTEEA